MVYENKIVEISDDHLNNNQSIENDIVEYIESKDMYFVFIDSLGFKETFKKKRPAYSKVFATYFSKLEPICSSTKQTYAGQTSDSLYFYTENADILFGFIETFLEFNLFAMNQNVFFRGGISKGTLYRKQDHQFYGDCVINAYELESQVAIYPRIALDVATYDSLKRCSGSTNISFDTTETGRYFINLVPPLCKDKENIESAKRQIKRNLKTYEFTPKTYGKYVWLNEKLESTNQKNDVHTTAKEDK